MTGAAKQPRGRREQKKRETRERIQQAAQSLFVAQGYAETTASEIASAARVSRQTFFNYFPEKSQLLDQLVALADSVNESLVQAALARSGSTAERLVYAFSESAKLTEALPELTRIVVIHGMGAGTPSARMQRLERSFERLFAAGVAQGDVREDLPLSFLAEMAAGVFTAVVLAWVENPDYPLMLRSAEAARFAAQAAAKRAGPGASRARRRASRAAE